jgi:hypothetical protein
MADEADLASLKAGGGTLYRHGIARFQTDLAMHLEAMIVITASKAGAKQNVSINGRYNSAKTTIETLLAKIQSPAPALPEGSSPDVSSGLNKQWTTAVNHHKLTHTSILGLIGTRVNEASTLELEFLAKGIFTENF